MLDIDRNNSHSLEELIDLLKGKRVFVQTHNFPDPDAIGSAFGLQQLLLHFDIESTLCYHGKIDRLNTRKMVEYLDIQIYSKDDIADMGENDPVICVDSQKNGGNILDLNGDEIACIDHHPTVAQIDYFYKDVRTVGSCCTQIALYFDKFGFVPDQKTATALMFGLQMDTNGFTRGVTDDDVTAFGLLHHIADPDALSRLGQNEMEFADLRAYGAAISSTQIFDKVGLASIPFACQDALIAITCDFILSLDEVDIAIVYSKRPDGYKISVRAETFLSDIDCGKIAAKALEGIGNGGGHQYMAGGFIPTEGVLSLGNNPDEALIERFLKVIGEA